MSVRNEFTSLMHNEMAQNDDIVLILGDLGYGHFNQHRMDFPDRVINPLAAEQLMVGMATGMALEGKIPVCYSITPFVIFRPYELLRNFLDHELIPVKLVGSGRDKDYDGLGFSHWGIDDRTHLNSFKNIRKFRPKDANEMKQQFMEFMYNTKPSYVNLSR
jgi:transketolase